MGNTCLNESISRKIFSMVKVENRPENRYDVLVKFEAMRSRAVAGVNKVSSDYLKNSIMYALARSKAEILSYNAMDVFVPKLMSMRTFHQSQALVEINTLKCLLEQAIIMDTSLACSFGSVLHEIDSIVSKVTNCQRSDIFRAKKGKEQVNKEFIEAKHKNFYVEKVVDHSMTDPHELDNRDPFGISGLIFDKE